MRTVTFLYVNGYGWHARTAQTDLATADLLGAHPLGPDAVRLAKQVIAVEADGGLWLLKDEVGSGQVPSLLNWGTDKSGARK